MTSEEYWKLRAEKLITYGEKNALQYEEDLKKSYERTIRAMKKEVEAFYGKYATTTGISIAEAKRKLKPSDAVPIRAAARDAIKEYADTKKIRMDDTYLKYLKHMSGTAYISRMDAFMFNINQELDKLTVKKVKGVEDLLVDGYEDSFYSTLYSVGYALPRSTGMGVDNLKIVTDFDTPGQDQLRKAVKEKWLGSNYSDRIWTNKLKLINTLGPLITQEFVRGHGPNEVGQALADKMMVSYSNAKRLIRTEMNQISNRATLDAYNLSGIVRKYQYLATLDMRTSEICQDMDGAIINLEDAEPGVNLPPLHPNCRSTTIPYFEDDEDGNLLEARIAKDYVYTEKNKRNYTLIDPKMSYGQWVKKYASPSYEAKVKAVSPATYVKAGVVPKPPITTTPSPSVGGMAKPEPPKPASTPATPPSTTKASEPPKTKQKGLPKTLTDYEAYNREFLEKRILSDPDRLQYFSDADVDRFSKRLEQLIDESEFSMRIPTLSVLKQILDSKAFKNQMQVRQSRGYYDPYSRKKASKNLFGFKRDDLKPKDYEKYGYLGQKNHYDEFRGYDHVAQYGEIKIVFKKANLMDRTTLTIGDSLGMAMNKEAVGTPTNKPTITACKFGYPPGTNKRFFESAKNMADILDNPDFSQKQTYYLRNTYASYIELQYHGDLTIDDIDYVYLDPEIFPDSTQRFQAFEDELNKYNIPIKRK